MDVEDEKLTKAVNCYQFYMIFNQPINWYICCKIYMRPPPAPVPIKNLHKDIQAFATQEYLHSCVSEIALCITSVKMPKWLTGNLLMWSS